LYALVVGSSCTLTPSRFNIQKALKYLEDSTSFFVNQARNTLDTTTASQPSDSWLGDTLNVVTKDLPVTLGATLAKTFASLASA